MSLFRRLRNTVARSYNSLPGKLPTTFPMEWFQMGYSPLYSSNSSVVEACVAAYAQNIALLPAQHKRKNKDGSTEVIFDSTVARTLDRPNEYQTPSDFFLNLVYHLLMQGNGYFIGARDGRGAVSRMYLLDPRHTTARLVQPENEVFYQTGGLFYDMTDAGTQGQVLIPSRFVGHLKLFTPNDPLVGVTPILSAASSIAANNAITNHQANFFSNMTRPSGVLTTDNQLSAKQADQLRTAWETQSKNMNSGGVPILSNGMKWEPMSMTSQDAELVNAWRMSVEDISRVFRVPPMIINNMENATFNNAEALMQFWLSSGLGFMIRHIETVLKTFFRLGPDEFISFDTSVLLRADLKARMEALGEGVSKGIYSPNEARAQENLPPVEGGDIPRVQSQMVPLDWEPNADGSYDNPAPVGDGEQEPAALPAPDDAQEEEERGLSDEDYYALLMASSELDLKELKYGPN